MSSPTDWMRGFLSRRSGLSLGFAGGSSEGISPFSGAFSAAFFFFWRFFLRRFAPSGRLMPPFDAFSAFSVFSSGAGSLFCMISLSISVSCSLFFPGKTRRVRGSRLIYSPISCRQRPLPQSEYLRLYRRAAPAPLQGRRRYQAGS